MKLVPLIGCTAILLASCAVNNTQSRISRNGGMYSILSHEHRRLVAAGQIAEGMSKDAVYLAWGTPSKVYKLEEKGISKERWVYTRRESQPTTTVGIGYASFPRYRRWGYCSGIHYGAPPRVHTEEQIGMVIFRNSKVESWERKQ